MIISKNMLNTGVCTIEGNILALHSDSIYCESNTYMPKWTVTDSDSYNWNRDTFYGWITLPSKCDISFEPPVQIWKDGSINCVLAYANDNSDAMRYPIFNRTPWMISNTVYYCRNINEFDGWIDLEFLIPDIQLGENNNG